MWLKEVSEVTKMWFDVVTKIKVCACSKNRTPVLEPSVVWMEIIHFTKVQIKSIDKCVIICSETACCTNKTPIFLFYVLLTVHLRIILEINLLAQEFYF